METPVSFDKYLVIFNPAANRGRVDRYRAPLQTRIEREREQGRKIEYVETTHRGEAQERAIWAAREGISIIVVGGDGSVHEVVNGLLQTGRRVPLGIIPAGSGNDYAWNALGLPHTLSQAIERAFHGRVIEVDAGKVNNYYFANAFSVGLDADIGAVAGQLKRFPLMNGKRLYYTATLRQLIFGYHRCPLLSFTIDEVSQGNGAEKRFVLLAVNNGPTYGAGFRINPTADPTDGMLNICAIDYTPLLRALRCLPLVQQGKHGTLPEAHFYGAKRVHIESRRPVTMQMDGEIIRDTHFDAEVLPAALVVRV